MRVGYNTAPYEKKMEIFQSFSGGLNTMFAPDVMKDTELSDILNMDIAEKSTLKRRHGLRKLKTFPHVDAIGWNPLYAGAQGYGRYYKTDGSYDEIFAINGRLYRNNETTALTIAELPTFQNSRPVDMAQFGDKLYIATGSKLLQYDGTTAKIIDPYLPTTMEMTYIGSNSLADNPESHIKDSIGLVASIDYVLPELQGDVSRRWISARVFVTEVTGEAYLYALQVRSASKQTEDWPAIQDTQWVHLNSDAENWLGVNATERWNGVYLQGKVGSEGNYEVRVVMKKVAEAEILSECVVPYKVAFKIDKPVTESTYTVHQCNRIFFHWNRLMLYGDPTKPTTLYMSHVNTPNYVPALLNLEFDNPKREPITSIVFYRNSLVIFTKSSTQALYGTSPDDYRRTMLHTDLGCISPLGASVMKNGIAFLSLQGIYTLKTMGLTDDKATVEKLDSRVADQVPLDPNAIAIFADDQFQITFPSTKTRLRFYPELAAWVKDYSEKFDFKRQYLIDSELYALSTDTFYVFDKSMFDDDDYNFSNVWESKYISFGQPYHKKKLKELHVLLAPHDDEVNSQVFVYADEEAVIEPTEGAAVVVDGVIQWQVTTTNNLHASSSAIFGERFEMGDSVFGSNKYAIEKLKLTGNCKRTRIRVVNTEPKENHFIGFAYIFKVRRPG